MDAHCALETLQQFAQTPTIRMKDAPADRGFYVASYTTRFYVRSAEQELQRTTIPRLSYFQLQRASQLTREESGQNERSFSEF